MASSMTGFGAAEGQIGARQLRVEVRTVNHRFFNFTARLPNELAPLEADARDLVRKHLERGHVSISLRWIDDVTPAKAIDWSGAEAAVESLRAVRDRFDLAGDVTIEMVVRYADLFAGRKDLNEAAPALWSEVSPIVLNAVEECCAARAKEGAFLVAELQRLMTSLEGGARRVQELAPERLTTEQTRLRAQLELLLAGRAVPEQRIAEEIALLADRVDISEELVRLAAHIAAVRTALGTTGPIGKQLGFLAQELGREVNTIGSKANYSAISHEVVAMKGELEKFREQIENLE